MPSLVGSEMCIRDRSTTRTSRCVRLRSGCVVSCKGSPAGSCAERLCVPLLTGCLAKHPSSRSTVRVHVRRARQSCVLSSDGIAISTCRRHCRRVPDLATASDDPRVAQHLQYMERQWISSTTWPPIPGQSSVSRCGPSYGQLNLYKLIQLLYAETALVQLNVRLLSEGHAMRLQRKSFAALHSRLSKYWDEYVAGTRSAHRPIRLAIVSLYHNKRSRILHQRHFGTEMSYGHFGTSAEMS